MKDEPLVSGSVPTDSAPSPVAAVEARTNCASKVLPVKTTGKVGGAAPKICQAWLLRCGGRSRKRNEPVYARRYFVAAFRLGRKHGVSGRQKIHLSGAAGNAGVRHV